MQQAVARLIIEGGPLTPGILQVLTADDNEKLEDIWSRLSSLSRTLYFIRNGIEDGDVSANDMRAVLHQIENTVDDLAAIAGGFARKEAA